MKQQLTCILNFIINCFPGKINSNSYSSNFWLNINEKKNISNKIKQNKNFVF